MSNALADDQYTGTEWTRDELQAAFDLVADPNDWKAPIKGTIRPNKRAVVREAVVFYTGTVPSMVEVLDHDSGRQVFEVESVGYRNGPCGP